MTSSNGHGWNSERREDAIRRLLDEASASVATEDHPVYVAEEIEPLPRVLKALLGPSAVRLTDGRGRIYPRAEWIWRWVVLASVLGIVVILLAGQSATSERLDEIERQQAVTSGRMAGTHAVLDAILKEVRDE